MNYLDSIIKGGKTGWNSFFTGLEMIGSTDRVYTAEEYESMYILQELQKDESFTNFLDNSFELSQSAGNMTPSVLIGTLTANPALATTLMGVSSGGNSYHSALVSGSEKGEAILYGTLSGLSEASLQYFLGGIEVLKSTGGVKSFKDLCKVLAKGTVEEGTEEATKMTLKTFLRDMVQEGTEEGLQTIIDTSLQSSILNEDFSNQDITADTLKSALYGALMGGFFNTPKLVASKISDTTISLDDNDNIPTRSKTNYSIGGISWYEEIERANELSDADNQMFHFIEVESLDDIPYDLYAMLKNDNIKIKVNNNVYTATDIDELMQKYMSNIEKGKISIEDQLEFWKNQIKIKNYQLNQYINAVKKNPALSWGDNKENKVLTEYNNLKSRYTKVKNKIIMNLILDFINATDKKYGSGSGIAYLKEYIRTGNINYIIGDNNFKNKFSKYDYNEIKKQLKKYISLTNDKSSNIELYNWYEKNYKKTGVYGVDQAVIEKMFTYNINGKIYRYAEVVEYYEKIKKIKKIEIKTIKTQKYRDLHNKLKEKGFSSKDAHIVLRSINRSGVCSYASLCNEIFYKFRDAPKLFEEIFGYSYYEKGDEKSGTNSSELLLDLYLFANDTKNGGKLFSGSKLLTFEKTVDVFGNRFLDDDKQVNMSSKGRNVAIINKFLKSKDPSLEYKSYMIMQNTKEQKIESNTEFNEMLENIITEVNTGSLISMSYYYSQEKNDKIIRMKSLNPKKYEDFSTAAWEEAAGHSVTITGIFEDGFVVSSWGEKYLIPFADLKKGGRVRINVSNITIGGD